MVTTRSPCCGYNLARCVELKGEYLWSYSHKIESVSLRMSIRSLVTNREYLSTIITETNIFRVLPTRWRRRPAGIDTERNYITVTLCISPAARSLLDSVLHCESKK